MERYYQRRADCRRSASMPGSCERPTPYMMADHRGSCSPTAREGSCPSARETCRLTPRADFNVCGSGECRADENAMVGMGYVPWQGWECTYPLDKGLFVGTVFPSLDKPFVIGRYAVRP